MATVELTEALLAKAAGWDVVKQARALLAADKVLSSSWTPPLLKGVVQAGTSSYRAGLVIRGPIDIENVCTCRESRDVGIICAHSVAIGLHWLRPEPPPLSPAVGSPLVAGKVRRDPMPGAGVRTFRRAAEGEAGEPLEISVIFPPNLADAVLRGKVMVYFEGGWTRGRVPLNALPEGAVFKLGPADTRLVDAAELLTGGEAPGSVQFTTAQLAELLTAMVEHPRVTVARQRGLTVSARAWRPQVQARLEANGEIRLKALASSKPPVFIAGEKLWVLNGDVMQPVTLPAALNALLQDEVRIARPQVPAFMSRDWPALEAACELNADFSPADFVLEPAPPKFVLSLAGGIAQLSGTLQCRYGPRILTPGLTPADDLMWIPDGKDPRRYSMRDLAGEQAALERLRRAGFNGPDAQGRLSLAGEQRVVTFFARDYPRIEREWEVSLEERLERSTQKNLERLEPQVRITSSGERWFDLEVSVAGSDGERFSPAEIQRLILSGQSHTRLRNGKIALINTEALAEFNEVLRDCAPQQHANGYRLGQQQAGFIEATIRQSGGWKLEAPPDWAQRVRAQRGEATLTCPPLGELEGVLRPYQKQGVAWLRFLRDNGFGGILADDMGLGKTLQVLALIASGKSRGEEAHSEKSENRKQKTELNQSLLRSAATLVVCPTSLVFNWVNEAAKFTPGLRVLALEGPQRFARFDRIPEADLVVTSYALMRRDAEFHRDFEFDTVVLDEAQHIKNRETLNAQAVKAVRARHRLVLTGTPLENSVFDLWSIFDFLMPGYLGTAQDFRERYEVPIVRLKDVAAQARLARRLKPFLLRRLKSEVAKELPSKIEQVSFCELTEDQAAVYREILAASRREVMSAVGEQGLAKSRMIILNALLRLRQVCCDLRLLKLSPSAQPEGRPQMEGEENTSGAVSESAAGQSGKLELFSELLEEAMDGGHRALVFSQFTRMLALIRERLTAEGVEFCYLDGSTVDRGKVVQRFQEDATVPVFLISLKAGGVGLNLTGADTVIHFDPWWNPAVEDQATDRAHRIGQTRVVTSYKLITRGTVEEKILSLQSRKRDLIRTVLGDEPALTEALTWEEIQELFAS